MRILFIGPMSLPIPSEKGAVEEIIWQTAKRLKAYAEVLILNPVTRSTIRKYLIGKMLAFTPADIVHSHNLYASLGLTTIPTKRHLLTLHYPPWIAKSSSRKKALISILRTLDTRGVFIVAPSIAVAKFLVERGFKNVIYIPNGIDTEMFNPAKRSQEVREILLDGKEILIVNVARIHPDKNQLAALKALKCVISRQRDVKMVFVGPTSGSFTAEGANLYYTALLKYVEKHSLKPYVHFLGEVPRREQVATILASSDIYLHPSKVEAAPLAPLEAMASGLPVIAFDLPFYKGYLFNNINSILIQFNDIDELCSTLIMLIEDKKLRQDLAHKAHRSAQNYFSWNVIVQKYYLQIYQRLLTS